MNIKNVFKKIILSSLAGAVALTTATFVSAQAEKPEDVLKNEQTYSASQDFTQEAKQTVRQELDFMSEDQVKRTTTILNDVFMKYLGENDLLENSMPIIINEKPYLISLFHIPPVENGKESRTFETYQIYELQNSEEAEVLFKNLHMLSNYQQGYENISLVQAKDSLAELVVLFNLNSTDIIKVLTSSKNEQSLVNKSYLMSKASLDPIFDDMKKSTNVKGKVVLDSDMEGDRYLYILNYIGENFNTLQTANCELEQ